MLKKVSKSKAPKAESESNPYIDAKRAWNDRNGSAVSYGRAGLMFGFASLLVSIPALWFGMSQSRKSTVVPYVIEVDSLGNVRGAGPAQRSAVNEEYIVKAALTDFIQNWRGVSVDGFLQKARIDKLYAYLGPNSTAVAKTNAYFQEGNDPFEVAQSKTVSVRVSSVNIVPNTNSYNVEWYETDYNRAGQRQAERRYQGVLTIQRNPPQRDAIIRVNPLGLYVIDYDITEV